MNVVNMTYYIMNRALIRPIFNKTPYELSIFEGDLIFHIFMSLDINIMFTTLTKTIWMKLIPNLMKFSFLDILHLVNPFKCLTE